MHARGAFDILLALGPDNIRTEIEKDMFITQAGGMVRVDHGAIKARLTT